MGTTLTIGAVLCWYAEPPASLERCLTSLVGVADFVAVLDGPWQPFPAVTCRSTVEEWRTVAASPVPVVYGPVRWWRSQIEKRTASLELATNAGADWIFVIDADEHVVKCDVERLRHRLASPATSSVATIHSRRVGMKPRNVRRLYRAIPGLRYEKAHSGVITPDRRWLSGDPGHVRLEPADDLSEMLAIFHEQGVSRSQQRQDDDAKFQQLRHGGRLEDWAERW